MPSRRAHGIDVPASRPSCDSAEAQASSIDADVGSAKLIEISVAYDDVSTNTAADDLERAAHAPISVTPVRRRLDDDESTIRAIRQSSRTRVEVEGEDRLVRTLDERCIDGETIDGHDVRPPDMAGSPDRGMGRRPVHEARRR